MIIYRANKAHDRQMARSVQSLASSSLQRHVAALASLLLLLRRDLNGMLPNSRSKHLADSRSVLSERDLRLLGKSHITLGFRTPGGV